MWDFSGSSLSVSENGKREKEVGRKTEWELGRGVSGDSIRATVYYGMMARYTVVREGD